MDQQAFEKELESYRLETAYLKHLTTLSTSAILVAVAFFEKIGQQEHRAFLFYALIGFLVTIACALYINFRLVLNINDDDLKKLPGGFATLFDAIALVGGLIAFFASICLLVYFLYLSMGI
jgi:hypothetical protein